MSVLLSAALVVPVVAHGPVEYADWIPEWGQRANEGFTTGLIAELNDFLGRHPPRPDSLPASNGGGEEWRSLVTFYFSDRVDKALMVIQCESDGDPNATNPVGGYAGLFQHAPQYWPERSQVAGWGGTSIYHPEANIAVAAWLVNRDGWGHWPRCGR